MDTITKIPKAELHLHIEGTLEPEMVFALAKRNKVSLAWPDAAALRKAYAFTNLQSFLDIYYAGASVLLQEEDFYDMTMAYLARAWADGVVHAELFFDPQTHTARGVFLGHVINGISKACADFGKQTGMTTGLIACFLRHLSQDDAYRTFGQLMPWRDKLMGVGLDSSESGNPPSRFAQVFALARAEGLHLVAHAGEEGPPSYIWEALDVLKVERIDHGVRCLEDAMLVQRLVKEQVPLTVCPLSNVKLCVFPSMKESNLGKLLDAGLCVTLNSDDPAYFGGYVEDNFKACMDAGLITQEDVLLLAKNSFKASFLPAEEKARHIARLDSLGTV